jgi:hypothetical protein
VRGVTQGDWPVSQHDLTVTVLRLITFPAHAALEFAGGVALMAIPFALGFSPAGLLASVAAGALVAGMALGAASREGGGLAVAGHLAFDRAMALALVGGALALAAHGDPAASTTLLVGSLGLLALTVTTRYSATH